LNDNDDKHKAIREWYNNLDDISNELKALDTRTEDGPVLIRFLLRLIDMLPGLARIQGLLLTAMPDNDMKCARPSCGDPESNHRALDIFLYECLVESCGCPVFCYFEPGRDYQDMQPPFDDPAIHSDTCAIVDCPADHG